jgi:hypothetical protein
VAGVIALPVAVVIAVAAGSGGSQGTISNNGPARLRATLDVRNDATHAEPDAAGRYRYTDATQPTIYVNLRNDGHIGTAIDRVNIVVAEATEIRVCDPRGGEEIETWETGISLPAGLEVGQSLATDKPVAYNVAADDAGRFALRLKPDAALLREPMLHLYRFEVKLRQVSSKQWLDAGAAVMLLPDVWPPDFDGTGGPLWRVEGGHSVDVYAPCAASNRRELQRLASGQVELSERLRSVLP